MASLNLDNTQQRFLRKAMMDAFTLGELDMVLQDALNVTREDIAIGDNKEQIVFKSIRHFDARGKLEPLVRAVFDERGGNPKIQAFVQSLNLPTFDEPQARLEALVRQEDPELDLMPWLATIEKLRRRICRIEYPVASGMVFGTGFLVAPDLVLTNEHVIARLKADATLANGVKLVFDYLHTADGFSIGDVTQVELADDWHVDSSPHSPADLTAGGGSEPTLDELDFAVIRIAKALGDKPLPITGAGMNSPLRGWINLCPASEAFSHGAGIQILQHPQGDPLKIAFGRITAVNGNSTRLRYDANTKGGSSGAPVFDRSWRLMGLHHSGDPNFSNINPADYNQAVPLYLIRDRLIAGNVINC